MSRKDLPYLPLYVQDFLTDEKLNECSASSVGVYIKIMCVLHKCLPYGKILLKQKDKQTDNQIEDFALKFVRHLPYPFTTILSALKELIAEEVLSINNDTLYQKRMVEDSELSIKRSKSGKKGGSETQKTNKNFALANVEANTDNEIDNVNVNESSLIGKMIKTFKKTNISYPIDKIKDPNALFQIAIKIGEIKGFDQRQIMNGHMENVIEFWEKIVFFISSDKWFSTRSLFDLNNEWQRIIQSMNSKKDENRLKTIPFKNEQKSNAAPLKRISNV